MKTKAYLIIFIFTSINAFAQKSTNNFSVNEAFPKEFLNKSEEIYFDKNIGFTDTIKQIFTTYGASFVLHAIIENQVEIKENEISKEDVFKNDIIELPKIILDRYEELFSRKNLKFAENKNSSAYTLVIKIHDHGFHWATSSAAGLFIRTKAELISSNGEIVWEQYYMMDKKEAKIPYNCKAMNMNKAIDNNIEDFEKDPDLLTTTYEQIADFLVAKFISSDN